MPLIKSTYKPPFLFKNTHFNTIYKTLFFRNEINYTRKRITTTDNDFIDLDFSLTGSNTMVIAMHGLEGSSKSKYIISLCDFLNQQAFDCVAVNFRGCSGEDNNKLYSYNSGKSDDLATIINYLTSNYSYQNIVLVGYSMGGNITLKYLGESTNFSSRIKGAIAISVPCDLEGSSNALAKRQNTIYINRFLRTLKRKTIFKTTKFPNHKLDLVALKNAKDFKDFDDLVTAPLAGYKNAKDYWTKCSSKQFLPNINLPTLIINALDDTFLSASCFPFEEAKKNKNLYLETPKYGGHVGFNTSIFKKDKLWIENRVQNFILDII